MRPVGEWRVMHSQGSAGNLHAESAAMVATGASPDASALRRTIRVVEVGAPAVVLGSAQPGSDVDRRRAAAAGVEIARRRSGGGAVLVGPSEVLWVDVVVPAGDPLHDDDVGRAGLWLGACWSAAVGESTGARTTLWRGGLVPTRWSRQVCFAGRGPSEVIIDGGAKVVGLSQRRTRRGTLFQTAALLRWRPSSLVEVLAVDGEQRRAMVEDLAGVATGLGPVGPELLDALLERIRRAG